MSGEIEEVLVSGTRPRPAATDVLPWVQTRPEPGSTEGLGDLPDAANEPLPDAANDELPLEEVKVTGKNLQRFMRLLRITLRGWPGYGSALTDAELLELYQEAVNEQTEQSAAEQPDVEEGLDPDLIEELPLEEVIVTANELNRRPGQFRPGLGDFGYGSDLAKELQRQVKLLRMEEVVVTAKKTNKKSISEAIVPMSVVELFFQHYWLQPHVAPLDYGYRPNIETLPEGNPVREPNKAPHPSQQPDADPDDSTIRDLPGLPEVQGSVTVSIDPNVGLQLKIQRALRPQRQEENKPRKDKKYGKAVRMYRSILRLHTTTFGTYSEIMDFMDVLMNNVVVDGKYLWKHDNPYQALLRGLKTGKWDIDWEGFAVDFAANQAQDMAIGKSSAKVREALNDMGYWGPDPGSYTPNFGGGP